MVQMAGTDAEVACIAADYEADLGLLFSKMSEDRRRQANTALKRLADLNWQAGLFGLELFSKRKVVRHFRLHPVVKDDDHAFVVVSMKFTDSQRVGAGSRLPVYETKVVIRLVISECEQVLTQTAFVGRQPACIERHGIKAAIKRIEFGENV